MNEKIALTIKPTMNCNMKCKHCFNGDVLNYSEMIDIRLVYFFIEAACKEYKEVKVTFHGGEPTLAGDDFYEKIFKFQKEMKIKYGVDFHNYFTTNAIQLSERLMKLLIEHDTLINISFDGPYNHLLRQNGDIVYKKILKVKELGGRIRVFCTISKDSCENLLEIYEWFKYRNIDFKILPIEARGYAAIDKELLMDTDKFIDALTRTYRRWITDKDCKIRLYTFEEFIALRRDTQFKPFWFNREIALNPDGGIYPFGRPNDVQFCLGRPSETLKISDCFESDEYKRMLEILENMREKCKNCPSSGVCNGVCICMSYMYVQDENLLNYSCNQSNRIFESILNINDEIMRDMETNNYDKYTDTVKSKYLEK